MITPVLPYKVRTFRDAGLQARWARTRQGAPIIAVRKDDDGTWFVVDAEMWRTMNKHGIKVGFESHTCLGDVFSIPA